MTDMYENEKIAASTQAISHVLDNQIIGVGTGSTVNYFIKLLANEKHRIKGTVASSKATELLLKKYKIPVFELNDIFKNNDLKIDVYIDGADEYNSSHVLIKGKGGALTREKIIAAASDKFVCIVDSSKETCGLFGIIPIEVIPMSRGYVSNEIKKIGGTPIYREKFVTDNGNIIIDIHNLVTSDPLKLEMQLNNIPGIVCNGIFAINTPDVIISGSRKYRNTTCD